MPAIRIGHFEADGDAVNLELGFVPAYMRLVNLNAADGEVSIIEWFGTEMGDDKAVQHTILKNDGGDDNSNIAYVTSSGYVSAYGSTTVVDSGTEDDDDDPVRVTNRLGVTIAAAWMDDSDEIFYIAVSPDRNTDHGDINA